MAQHNSTLRVKVISLNIKRNHTQFLECKHTLRNRMALVVDRFDYLAREIISTLTSARDALAVVGTLYAARKTLSILCRLLTTLKTYGIAPSWCSDFRQRYGEWAGWRSLTTWTCLILRLDILLGKTVVSAQPQVLLTSSALKIWAKMLDFFTPAKNNECI